MNVDYLTRRWTCEFVFFFLFCFEGQPARPTREKPDQQLATPSPEESHHGDETGKVRMWDESRGIERPKHKENLQKPRYSWQNLRKTKKKQQIAKNTI